MEQPLKILLVEDNESDGALLIRQLEKANYKIKFKRVESRLEMETSLKEENWDIVISDYSLPQFTAHDSLKVLQESAKDIPFIVVSGTIGEVTAVEMMKAGAQDYLMKDNLTRLAPAITRELDDAQVRRDRKRAFIELRESEAKFRAVWESSKDAIGVSISGIMVLVNPAYIKLFGYEDEKELIGQSVIELIAPEEKKRIEDFIKLRSVDPGIPYEYETIGLKKDGTTFDMDVKVSLFDYNNQKHTISILRDVTERKLSEERLRQELAIRTEAEKRAEESNLVKSSLMMNMSHEVRTPLNAILGFSNLIGTESTEDEIRQMALRINTSGERLMKTLDDILELTQLQTGSEIMTMSVVDLNSEINGIIKKVLPLAAIKQVELKFLPDAKISAVVDPRLFNKAISELLNNAVKFTHSGYVRIETEQIKEDNGLFIEIRVSDTGIGIAQEYHQVIFESFRQVSGGYNRSFEGTGLGLTIAKQIVELLKGELLVESELGKGSIFTIRIPDLAQIGSVDTGPQIKEKVASPEMKKEIPGRKEKPAILLVEDNEENVLVTKEFCKAKYEIDAVDNANDALQMANDKAYDAILMDINLGLGMNGLEVATEIRKMKKNILTPIIALTGYTTKEDQMHILKHGCDYYLGKPFSQTEILKLLETVI